MVKPPQADSPSADCPRETGQPVAQLFFHRLQGPVYGAGITLAAGYNQYFASVDANYTESDLDIGDSTIEAFVISPRIGVPGSLGGLNGSLYVGAMYQDVDEQQNGTANFPVMGQAVPVDYDVISEAEEQWNYLVGANLKAGESWNYGIEIGFSERTHVMASSTTASKPDATQFLGDGPNARPFFFPLGQAIALAPAAAWPHKSGVP
ncbi:MAG: hypothetical protein CM1200mP34_1420 [Verrucomicrobiales bacterium]|nr:MAG: hypothetical protein CM1200mP34_1420 [Verrucomicrobiales bacterium]